MPETDNVKSAQGSARAKNTQSKIAAQQTPPVHLTLNTKPPPSLLKQFFEIVLQTVENRRLLILQPFALIAGIIFYVATVFEPDILAIAGVAIALVSALFVWRGNVVWMPVLLLLCGIWTGFSLLPIHGSLFGTEMVYGSFFGKYSARVDAIHSNDSERSRIIISNITPLDDRRQPPIRRARILLPSDQIPQIGDVISASLRLYRVPGPVVPGGFDSQFHAYFDGIGAYGSATSEVIILQPLEKVDFFRWIQDIRDGIGTRIDASLAPPVSGIARALIIGDQGQVDDEIRANLAAAGLAHVLAISGLHLSLVAGGVFAAVRMALAASYLLGQKMDVKKIAALGGMTAALIYLGLSGASVSAIRATLMLMLIFGAVLAGRKALTMRNVAFAAIFVIITDPASIFRPSFQLSFAAVTALVGAYENYRPTLSASKGWVARIWGVTKGIALTSIIAGAATALFAAYHFQQVAPLGVLGNTVAIPLVSFVILPAALIGVLLMPFGIETPFFRAMGWGIEQVISVATQISSIGAELFVAPILGSNALLIGLASLGWFAFFAGRLRYVGIGMAAIALPLFGTMPPPDILIADTTQALAMRDTDKLELFAGRQNSFAVRVWSETYLQPIEQTQQQKSCDAAGCYYRLEDYDVALIKSREAFLEDCAIADLVIARINVPSSCRQQVQTIDRRDLQNGGVHWLKWTGEEFWIRPAMTDIYRPWRAQFPD